MTGVDTLTEVPADRWDVDLFDAWLFGIAPYQIGQIDPQQRLILKIALENSGITPEKLPAAIVALIIASGGMEPHFGQDKRIPVERDSSDYSWSSSACGALSHSATSLARLNSNPKTTAKISYGPACPPLVRDSKTINTLSQLQRIFG